MENTSKYPQKLIDKAHDLAFRGELSNKQIASKLGLEYNQLHYIIYKLNESGSWIQEMKDLKEKPKKLTITESLLNFFIADKFR